MSNSATMALLFLKAKKAIEVIIRCGLVLHPTVPIWNNSLQLSQQINCLTNPPFVLYFQSNNRQNDFHGFLLHCIILQRKCAIPGNPININVHGGDGTKVKPFLMFHSQYFTKEISKTKKNHFYERFAVLTCAEFLSPTLGFCQNVIIATSLNALSQESLSSVAVVVLCINWSKTS